MIPVQTALQWCVCYTDDIDTLLLCKH